MDALYLLITLLFFAASAIYAEGCHKLR